MPTITVDILSEYEQHILKYLSDYLTKLRTNCAQRAGCQVIARAEKCLEDMRKLLQKGELGECVALAGRRFPDLKDEILTLASKKDAREGFLVERLFGFWLASDDEERLRYLQHINQLAQKEEYESSIFANVLEVASRDRDPVTRREAAYGATHPCRRSLEPLVEALGKDPDRRVRMEATLGKIRPAVSYVLDVTEATCESFTDEHQRYQLLARTRKILREHVFGALPSPSPQRSVVTAIINATNRTTAKSFRYEYLDILRDSLLALRDGIADAQSVAELEQRLLKIDEEDDECEPEALLGHDDPD